MAKFKFSLPNFFNNQIVTKYKFSYANNTVGIHNMLELSICIVSSFIKDVLPVAVLEFARPRAICILRAPLSKEIKKHLWRSSFLVNFPGLRSEYLLEIDPFVGIFQKLSKALTCIFSRVLSLRECFRTLLKISVCM